jgi:hypothetical protein
MSRFFVRASSLHTVLIRDPREFGDRALIEYRNMEDFGHSPRNKWRVFASSKSLVVYDPKTLLVLGRAAPHRTRVDQRTVASNIITGVLDRLWDNPDPNMAVYLDGRCKIESISP